MLNRCVSRKTAYAVSLFCSFLLTVFPGFVNAQEAPTTGTIQGTVHDADGNPISGARLVFHSREAVSSSVTRSGKDGSYVSDQLVPGKYTVLAEGRNFKVSQTQVTVQVGAAATANFQLEPINPGPARPESTVPGETVDTLPINGRNYLDLAQFEPGVQVVDGAILDPGKSGYQTLSLNSTLGRTTHHDLDEVEAMDETRGTVIQNLPAEAVRDLIVARSTPDVFQSLNANGSVRVTTRSGSDEWHGNLFGNYRDGRAGVSGFPGGSSNYSRQQYGFGAGGSIIKDKAFIFLGGERTKQDGFLPVYPGFPANFETLRDATLRENMLTGRLDYNLSENAKFFTATATTTPGSSGRTTVWPPTTTR